MDDVVRVTVFESRDDLLEEPPSLVLGHLASADDVIKQLSGEIFDDHDDVVRCRNHVVPVQ